MMYTGISTAHLVLGGVSLLAASITNKPISHLLISCGTFGNILLYSLVGFLSYAIPDLYKKASMRKFLEITHSLTRNLALPSFVTYLYLACGYPADVAYSHFVSGSIPVLLHLLRCDLNNLTDVILACNIVSLAYISYSVSNFWGIGLAVCQSVNHFWINYIKDNLSAPVDCLFVIGMCFFNLFAVKTLKYC